jgi:ribosomal protein S12 methylthiotransferase
LEWRKLYPGKKILLAGCLSQRYAKELPGILPEADGFIGVTNPAETTEKVSIWKTSGADLSQVKNEELLAGERPLLSLPGSAYVKISEGCDNRCSYCAIPLIRGSLVCRAIPDILGECGALLKRGVKELCIIGQDIGAYSHELPELLKAISFLKGDFWVRLLYIHPDHFPFKILDIMENDKRFLPYFDIPFQHASAKILNAMNRRGTSEKHLELINAIRARLPDAVIRSTFLTGFPGETEKDFTALLDFQEQAKLDWLGCFVYSREEGTAAYSMKNRVPAKTAVMRKQIIEERQASITEKNMDRFTGRIMEVLIEEEFAAPARTAETDQEKNIWLGRLYCQAPDIDGSAVIISGEESGKILKTGTFEKCRVTARRGIDLEVRV